MGAPGVVGSKPHQTHNRCMGVLNDVLDRFDSRSTMASTFKEPVKILHDPEMPYSEVTAMLSSLSGCMPAKLEETIRFAMGEMSPASRPTPSCLIGWTVPSSEAIGGMCIFIT